MRGNRFLGMWEGRSFLENVMEGDRFEWGLGGAIAIWGGESAIAFWGM